MKSIVLMCVTFMVGCGSPSLNEESHTMNVTNNDEDAGAEINAPEVCSNVNEDCTNNSCCSGTVCLIRDSGKTCVPLCKENTECATACCSGAIIIGTDLSINVCSEAIYCPDAG